MSAGRPTIASGTPEFPTNRTGPRSSTERGPRASSGQRGGLTAAALRRLDRKSRHYRQWMQNRRLPESWLASVTAGSFRLEDLDVSEDDVLGALALPAARRVVRSVRVLRLRNHVAILRGIERLAGQRIELNAPAVLRWYTSISCGLSIAAVDPLRTDQLAISLRRLNSFPMRLQLALQEAAALYCRMMDDPVFPGFNGVLARLLLQHQLLRSQLPPVRFEPELDGRVSLDPSRFAGRLMELAGRACEAVVR